MPKDHRKPYIRSVLSRADHHNIPLGPLARPAVWYKSTDGEDALVHRPDDVCRATNRAVAGRNKACVTVEYSAVDLLSVRSVCSCVFDQRAENAIGRWLKGIEELANAADKLERIEASPDRPRWKAFAAMRKAVDHERRTARSWDKDGELSDCLGGLYSRAVALEPYLDSWRDVALYEQLRVWAARQFLRADIKLKVVKDELVWWSLLDSEAVVADYASDTSDSSVKRCELLMNPDKAWLDRMQAYVNSGYSRSAQVAMTARARRTEGLNIVAWQFGIAMSATTGQAVVNCPRPLVDSFPRRGVVGDPGWSYTTSKMSPAVARVFVNLWNSGGDVLSDVSTACKAAKAVA